MPRPAQTRHWSLRDRLAHLRLQHAQQQQRDAGHHARRALGDCPRKVEASKTARNAFSGQSVIGANRNPPGTSALCGAVADRAPAGGRRAEKIQGWTWLPAAPAPARMINDYRYASAVPVSGSSSPRVDCVDRSRNRRNPSQRSILESGDSRSSPPGSRAA
jgi:hypothetical protein